jgi:hypothetical protein
MTVVSTPVTPFDVRPHRCGQGFNQKRHQPEREIDHHLVGNKGHVAHDREGHDRAGGVAIEDRPDHILPPRQRAPAVGRELDERKQHHAGGDVEIDQQHAEQHHAAGHAEHAGNERGDNDSGADEGERKGGHFQMRRRD